MEIFDKFDRFTVETNLSSNQIKARILQNLEVYLREYFTATLSFNSKNSTDRYEDLACEYIRYLFDLTDALYYFYIELGSSKVKNNIYWSNGVVPSASVPIFLKVNESFKICFARFRPVLEPEYVDAKTGELKKISGDETLSIFYGNDELTKILLTNERTGDLYPVYDFETEYIGMGQTLKNIELYQKEFSEKYKTDIKVSKDYSKKEILQCYMKAFSANITDLQPYDFLWDSDYVKSYRAKFDKLKSYAQEQNWL